MRKRSMVGDAARKVLGWLPDAQQQRARKAWRDSQLRPRRGCVRFGDLRRLEPISRDFGYDRGLPIDRHYIEGFLERHRADVTGRVLEVGDNTYTMRFGGANVTRSDVLFIIDGNPDATIVGDLSRAEHIEDDLFDCIVLTQTLHLIFDLEAAVGHVHRILKPGGTLLLTVPGISPVKRCDWGDDWNWALTRMSLERLLERRFGGEALQLETHGNVLVAIAFLQGLATEELEPGELERVDEEYQLIITARAVKAGGAER